MKKLTILIVFLLVSLGVSFALTLGRVLFGVYWTGILPKFDIVNDFAVNLFVVGVATLYFAIEAVNETYEEWKDGP